MKFKFKINFFIILIAIIIGIIFFQRSISNRHLTKLNIKLVPSNETTTVQFSTGNVMSVTTSNIKTMSLELKSALFKDNDFIPSKYSCDGEDINPALEIKNAPDNTKSFVIIMDDPDAVRKPTNNTFIHWLIWNIDAKTTYIEEDSLPPGSVQGKNDFPKIGYGGPCPPVGNPPHHYHFTVYALDTILNLPEGSNYYQLWQAMQGHILDQASLVGLYQRK
ncbi:MAG: YbhB/YbcL family Raf kinase inhibitor-like protein [Minisyncoccia bacterium]